MAPSSSLLLVLIATYVFVFFRPIEAAHSLLGHHHQHRWKHSVEGSHLETRNIGNSSVIAPTEDQDIINLEEGGVASFIDSVVLDWTQNDAKYNESKAEMSKLLDIAEKLKTALLNPGVTRATRRQEKASNITQQSQPNHRIISNSTILGNSTLAKARELVRRAQAEANAMNVGRFNNPRLNIYYTNTSVNASRRKRAIEAELFHVNETVAAAAALVAQADAELEGGIISNAHIDVEKHLKARGLLKKRAGTFWMDNIAHTGNFPYGGSLNNNYKVYRNVKDYGAKGDGKTDDTAAINKAMADGNRCGPNCGASTYKGAIVYFPGGQYLISSSIEAWYNTQMIGDPNSLPTLIAAPSFVGLGVVSSDKYIENGDGSQWYINQNNFLRQMRNFIIDTTRANMVDIAGLHWQVAQATSLQNMFFFQSTSSTKKHMGIFAENGSGGFMSDLYFSGGAIGMRCGNQQFTTRNLNFFSSKTAIDMLWDWGWTWKSLDITNADYGIKISGEYNGGSIQVLDSKMTDVAIGVFVDTPKGASPQQHFSINIDNLVLVRAGAAVLDAVIGTTLAGGTRTVISWVLGKVYDPTNPTGKYHAGGTALSPAKPRTGPLYGGPNGGYYERSKPQYEDLTAADFINANVVVKGDGITDDTIGLNLLAITAAAIGRPIFLPAGSYILTDTVTFGAGTKIVGACWSQLVAKGPRFGDMKNPRVMLRVGKPGDIGVMEIQDLMFTSEGPTPGAIFMEWNIKDGGKGVAAMWDSHFRVAGGRGSKLQVAQCPKLSGKVNPNCMAGSMLLHMTKQSSGYLENVWGWVADHDFDSGPSQTQIDIYVARGMLIETQGPTWMYGTASEHCVFYQYQLLYARDLFMGMIQTESPYWLPKPQAPAPFAAALGKFDGDPTFSDCPASDSHCKAAWGLRIIGSANVHILGAGLYNWFQDYTQTCVPNQSCQRRVIEIVSSAKIWLYNLVTIGTVEMINAKGYNPITAKANTNQNVHPFTSNINAWLLTGNSADPEEEFQDELDNYSEPPRCGASYRDIDEMILSRPFIPHRCVNKYLAETQGRQLDEALQKYTSVINDGYDENFQIYAKEIRALVPEQLREWMKRAQESGFFECQQSGYRFCCLGCRPDSERGCPSTCDSSSPCTNGYKTWIVDCPTTIPNRGTNSVPAINYILKDEQGFFTAILQEYGIQKDWVVFGRHKAVTAAGCWQNPDPVGCDEKMSTWWTGFPLAGDIDIQDPKELIAPNYDNTMAFSSKLKTQIMLTEVALTEASESDLADAASLPTFLTQAAVKSMTDVVAFAEEVKAAERQQNIFNFIMAFLLFIPMVGAALNAVALTALRSIILTLGALAEVALTVYDIVQDPTNAIWVILGLLLTPGRGRGGDFKQAADRRRALGGSDLDKLSAIRGELDKVNTVRTTCSL